MSMRNRILRSLSAAIRNSLTVNTAPTVSSVTFTGTLSIGQTLTGDYDYLDTDGDAESGTTYQWYRDDNLAGTSKEAIAGATNLTYVVTSADMNNYLFFGVTPNDGVDFGTEVISTGQRAWITNPLWASTVLLARFADGPDDSTTFVDETGRHTLTGSGGAKLDTAQNLYGDISSLLVDHNTTGYVDASSDSDFTFGNGDFTVEANFRRANDSDNDFIFGWGAFGPYLTGSTFLALWNGSTNIVAYDTGSNNVGIWRHVAITRQGTSLRTFVNGTLVSTLVDGANYSTNTFRIGHRVSGAGSFNGHITNVRVIKGAAAYTANFTPARVPGQYMAP